MLHILDSLEDIFGILVFISVSSTDGEDRTIEFMEQQTVITQTTPLLEGTCSYKVVEHPFPMNCFLKDWNLGPQFYHAVKIGIVQYVCHHCHKKKLVDLLYTV